MRKVFILILSILIIIVAGFFCQRTTPIKGELEEIQLTDLTGIPLEYGSLISVTTQIDYPGLAQLWFEDENKTIRVVRIEFGFNKVKRRLQLFPDIKQLLKGGNKMFDKLASIFSRIVFIMALVLLFIAILEFILQSSGWTLSWINYTPGRLLEFSAILLIFVIVLMLRQIREEIKTQIKKS